MMRQHGAAAVRHKTPVLCDVVEGAIPSIMIWRALDALASGRRESIDVHSWLAEEALDADRLDRR